MKIAFVDPRDTLVVFVSGTAQAIIDIFCTLIALFCPRALWLLRVLSGGPGEASSARELLLSANQHRTDTLAN